MKINHKVTFGLLLLIAQLFMFYSAESLFGEQFAEDYRDAMLGYLIFYFAFFDTLLVNPTMNMGLIYSISRFFPFLVIGIIAGGLGWFSFMSVQLAEPDPAYMKGVLLYQIVFVSNVEECIFREIMPRILPSFQILQIPISSSVLASVTFGLFHFGAYYYLSEQTGQNLTVLIITAILAGLMFQAVRNKFGLPASMGLHAGINISQLGVL